MTLTTRTRMIALIKSFFAADLKNAIELNDAVVQSDISILHGKVIKLPHKIF